jgi:hypothetical protein
MSAKVPELFATISQYLCGNINAPRQILIASSNAEMNGVLEEVYWDQSSVSRGETSNSRGS